MRYVIAGYVVILTLLCFYAVQLLWRRRRLVRAVARVSPASSGSRAPDTAAGRPA